MWLPVVVMLLVIVRESTDGLSSTHTGAFLRPVLETVFGRIEEARWEAVHHAVRKTGHFLGYGMLGLAWLRAWLLTWLLPMRLSASGAWQWVSLRMAVCCTALVAALDELHQTYIPSRTGLAQDVLLDTVGAVALCGVVALIWVVRLPVATEEHTRSLVAKS